MIVMCYVLVRQPMTRFSRTHVHAMTCFAHVCVVDAWYMHACGEVHGDVRRFSSATATRYRPSITTRVHALLHVYIVITTWRWIWKCVDSWKFFWFLHPVCWFVGPSFIMASTSSSKSQRKQTFREEYSIRWPCIIRSKLDDFTARCTVCQSDFSISHAGANDITAHVKRKKHINLAQSRESNQNIGHFFCVVWLMNIPFFYALHSTVRDVRFNGKIFVFLFYSSVVLNM